jgi:hypothetical protein
MAAADARSFHGDAPPRQLGNGGQFLGLAFDEPDQVRSGSPGLDGAGASTFPRTRSP